MGWCHEFGPQLHETCAQPMLAGVQQCECPTCGLVCTGRFAGCDRVWQTAASPGARPAPTSPSATPPPPPRPAPVVVPEAVDVPSVPPLGDMRSALEALRAEIEQLRAAELALPDPAANTQPPLAPERVADEPVAPEPPAAALPTYDELFDLTPPRRRSRWWRRHRAQHLG